MSPDCCQFTIRPNNSYQPVIWFWLLSGLVVVGLGVALRFAFLGLWLVLPFTVLELVAVVFVMHWSRRKISYVEKICIKDDDLKVYHLQANNNCEWLFPLYWARVNIVPPVNNWYPSRLLLGAFGKWVEVGQCLTDEERDGLAKGLQAEIRRALQ